MSAIFNGTNSYLSLSSGFGFTATNTLQIMCWFKSSTAQGALWTLGNTSSGDYRAGQMATTRMPRARSQNVSPASAANASAGSSASSNTWAAAAYQFDANNFRRAAINGTLGTSNTTTVSNIDAPDYFWVGREDDLSPVYFTGEIAYIVVHTGLNATHITNAASTSYDPLRFITDIGGSLVALYLLEGNGNDSSGNGYHLTANNITWGDQPYTFPTRAVSFGEDDSVSVAINPSLRIIAGLTEADDVAAAIRAAVAVGASFGDDDSVAAAPRTDVSTSAAVGDDDSLEITPASSVACGTILDDGDDCAAAMGVDVSVATQLVDDDSLSASPSVDVFFAVEISDGDSLVVVLGSEFSFTASFDDGDDVSLSIASDLALLASCDEGDSLDCGLAVGAACVASILDADSVHVGPSIAVDVAVVFVDGDSIAVDLDGGEVAPTNPSRWRIERASLDSPTCPRLDLWSPSGVVRLAAPEVVCDLGGSTVVLRLDQPTIERVEIR